MDPPDGGYGWVVVAAIFWNNAHHWGIVSSYGVFLAHFLSRPDITGGTSLDYAFIGGLAISQGLLMAPVASTINRRYGIHVTLTLGVVLETAALLGASWSTKIWHLYLSQGVCFGWGLGLQYITTMAIIPQWFAKRRSLAAGLATGGSGTGGLIYSLAVRAIIDRYGAGWAYRTLAITQGVVNTVCLLLLRERRSPSDKKKARLSLRYFKQYECCLLFAWGFLSVMGFVVLWFSLGDYARSIGLSASQGSIVTAVMNVGQIFGRPAVGYSSDVVGRMNMAALATFLSGLLCLVMWIFASSYASVLCFALLGGALFPTFFTVVAALAAEVVGLPTLDPFLTIIWLVCVIPATFGEAIGLKLRTSGTSEYLHPQIFTGIMYLGATFFVVLLRAWKISTLEVGKKPVGDESDVEKMETTTPSKSRFRLVKCLLVWIKV